MFLVNFHKLIEAPSIYYFIGALGVVFVMVIVLVLWDNIFVKHNSNHIESNKKNTKDKDENSRANNQE